MRVNQLSLYEAGEVGEKDDWTFQGAETRSLTHCYHDYPARMIPQIAGKLLDLFAPKHPALLFDPYCGTGTSLVEGMIRGLNVVGTDLNPLARLIARAKTTLPSIEVLDAYVKELWAYLLLPDSEEPLDMTLDGISRPEFWFKPEVFRQLARLRKFVTCIENTEARNFFAIAFSETARESSNTRRDEFKLYRYAESDLERHKPAPFQIMFAKLARNRNGLMALQEMMEGANPSVAIYDFNTVSGVPTRLLPPDSVDIVVTSPPYGDSQTTVAYGQYSRLSSAWLGLPDGGSVDSALMGGKKQKPCLCFLVRT
ncbi:hypothetical protein LBMAG21_08920 [Armatimonadota bacterium]|nr:hypothetical protein LBMAG21_08920 [Armatimonadota bacterium]